MLKTIRHSLDQGQHRLQYALELKEKVILNTEPAGATKILEDIESVKLEFDKLINEVQVRKSFYALLFVFQKIFSHFQMSCFVVGFKTEIICTCFTIG